MNKHKTENNMNIIITKIILISSLLFFIILFNINCNSKAFWQHKNSLFSGWEIYSVAFDSNNNVYVGSNRGLFKSTNEGNSWSKINNGITDTVIHSITITPNQKIFVATNKHGIFLSSNGGVNWIKVNEGLKDTQMVSIAAKSDELIFCGSYNDGIYRSTDGGIKWSKNYEGRTPMFSFSTSGNLYMALDPFDINGALSYSVFKSTNNGITGSKKNMES